MHISHDFIATKACPIVMSF